MRQRFGDLIAEQASRGLMGRETELRRLLQLPEQEKPLVMLVHGLGGVGKSSLLAAYAEHARARGCLVVALDSRNIEPTARSFIRELGNAVGGELTSVREAADRLQSFDQPVVLLLDTYEVFRTMDTWLRQTFVPQMPLNVRLVLAGREPPVSGWFLTPGWQGLVQELRLQPLDDASAEGLLMQAGFSAEHAHRVNRVTRGHPLAIKLATAVADQGGSVDVDSAASSRIADELARLYLDDIDDALTRQTLEAASLVRSVNEALLAAILPELAPRDAFERLRTLPFVESSRDGLHVHEVVQRAVATALRTRDPDRYRRCRRAAWRHLRAQARTTPAQDLWRYTADLLYILENPIVRESFFPSGAHVYAVEPARPDDVPSILGISARHEPETATHLLRVQCESQLGTVWVIRDPDSAVAGYFTPFVPDSVSTAWMRTDPLLRAWLEHLERFPVPRSQRVMFVPRLLSDEFGEAQSAVQASAWLETKRMYLDLRPHLRRVYFAQRDLSTPWPALRQLGFERVPEADVDIEGTAFRTAVLDFGASSVDGWLSRLIAAELGVAEDEQLDVNSRELVIDGARVALTPLEFSVMHYLYERAGTVVRRRALLEDIWGIDYEGGSNVVDAVVRTLRKKLGDSSSMIETVRGTGYRFRRTNDGTSQIRRA